MAGTECGALTSCPNLKRKATEAELDDDDSLSDGDNPGVDRVAAAVSAPAEIVAAPRQPKAVMSQEWIDSILSDENKPLPLNERLLRNPKLAAIFHSHEQSRARFAEYQDRIRRELETKGYVEVDDDYEERCELLHAVHRAAFYGREDEEKEAIAKLEALRRRP